jgi:hypothetical protein
MKAGGESTIKLYVMIALLAIAAVVGVRNFLSFSSGEPGQTSAATKGAGGKAASSEESLDPRLRLDLLSSAESVQYQGEGKNIFRSDSEVAIPTVKISPLLRKQQEQAAKAIQAAQVAQAALNASLPPPPPPINLKFFGFSNSAGDKPKAFLSQGDDVWVAREGDVVDRRYKILHISPSTVEVEDLLYNNHQSLRLTQG